MASHSFDPREALLAELREKFPEIFTEGCLDTEKMQNFLQCKFSDDKDRYRMTWAGRKGAIQQVQVKTTNTLVPELEQSVNCETTKNVFIEGDNLEVLRVLQKSYYGKVKMIYIDPPYNTGNDFIYHDNFKQNKADYRQKSGITDEEGKTVNENTFSKNREDQGHYHSDWLSMMFPRLYLAKNLLKHDGAIAVSIDDHEVANLRLMMNETFGEENFIAEIVWEKIHTRKNSAQWFSDSHEYILLYAKSADHWFRKLLPRENTNAYTNPDNDPKGPWKADPIYANKSYSANYTITKPNGITIKKPSGRYWRFSETMIKTKANQKEIIWGEGDSYPMIKRYLSEVQDGLVPVTLWKREFAGDNSLASSELHKLLGIEKVMSYPKPTKLITRLAQIMTSTLEQDIILDFFAGSGTTAHAVMQLNAGDGGNRKWICVQLDEVCDRESEAYKAGYKTIADIARERIRRAGRKIQEENKGKPFDVGFKAFRLAKSNFPVWQGLVQDEHDLLEQMDLFANAQQHDAEPIDLLYELILKEGLDINIDIQQKEIASGTYYLIDQGKLAISFASPITDKLMDALLSERPEKIILLESAFAGNDELKMNTVLHTQTLKIDIRVI